MLIFLAKELQELVSKDIQTDRGHHKLQKMETFWQFFELEVHDSVLDLEEAELQITPVFDNMA